MFDSKKWLIWFFALTLVGSIGGSLVAYKILQRQRAARLAALRAAAPAVETPARIEPATPAKQPVKEEAIAKVPPTPAAPDIDETVQPTFPIMSRAEWNAHAPVAEMTSHVPSIISIHHTATTAAPDKPIAGKLKGLQNFSQHEGKISGGKTKPAWPDLPYHFYIDAKGAVAEGCEIKYVSDYSGGYDATGQICIALEGNFENSQPTAEQMDVLFKMITWLSAKYKIPADKITSHKAYLSTACPGKNLESRLDEIRQFAWKK